MQSDVEQSDIEALIQSTQRPGRRRQSVHAQGRAQSPGQYRRARTSTRRADGIAGLDAIRIVAPDLVILDWEMPLLNGAEFVRIVRSPGVFPLPDVPIIMLTAHGERWRVVEASRLGVNEYPAQAGVGQGAARPHVAILRQAARDGAARRLLRARSRASCSSSRSQKPSIAPAPDGTTLN